MELESVCDGVWTVSAELRLGAGFWFPVRSTILRRASGGLVLQSPVSFDPATTAAIDALGQVEVIVAPSLLHHLFAGPAKVRWPTAKLLGVSGLAEKRPDLSLDGPLVPGSLGEDIACIPIEGAPKVNETVLVHRPSKTAVLVDLLFNIRAPRGALTPWVLRMVGAHERTAQSRAWRYLFVRDRAAFAASGRALLAEDIERVVFAHGSVIDRDARRTLERALRWMLPRAAEALPEGSPRRT